MRLARSMTLALLTLAVACGGAGESTKGADAGPLAPPASGIQLSTTAVTLNPGQQEYACWAFPLTQGQPFPIIGLEQQIPAVGVHHYAVFTSSDPVGSYTGAGGWGACAGSNDQNCFDCSQMSAAWGLVTGGGVGTPAVAFPQGTSMTLKLQNPPPQGQSPITQVVLQLHLLNATPQAIDLPPAYVNLDSTNQPPSAFQQVGLLIAGTLDINLPPGQTKNVQGGCGGSLTSSGGSSPAMQNIFAVFPHMHQLGTNIEVTLTPQGGSPAVLVDRPWSFGEQGLYPVKGSTKAGDEVQVTCTYDNTTDATVTFGLTTQDEMCLGVLYYYPADPTQTSQYCGFGG